MADLFAARVTGVDDLRRALDATTTNLDGALRDEFLDRARLIARDAKGRVPRRSGAAAATVDAVVLDQAATIVAGGRKAPYYPWLEFGGATGRRKTTRRPFVKDGRYIGSAVDASLDQIEQAALNGVVEAARAAGLEVTGGT